MTTWTCGNVYVFYRSKLLHKPDAHFYNNRQLNCQSEGGVALYKASCSVYKTFSGLYSAVMQ